MPRHGTIVWVCLWWAALAACSETRGTTSGSASDAAPEPPDAAPDLAAVDTRGNGWPFLPSNVPVEALISEAAEDVVLGPAECGEAAEIEIDTDALTVRGCRSWPGTIGLAPFKVNQSDGSQVVVLLTRSLRVLPEMRVSVRGHLPLVLAAQSTLQIAGTVRAAAFGEKAEAGGFDGVADVKAAGKGPGAGQGEARGGGGGASYCGSGGSSGPNGDGEPGNPPGLRYGNPRIVPLAGGSSGGNGGVWYSGGGGGAIQLVARHSIVISTGGVIHAGGGGGEQEGGGGGSGGAILLEAPLVIVAGGLAANGGAGGSASKFGQDATADDQPAPGGDATFLNTGEGGDGSAGLELDGEDGRPNPTFANGDFSGGGGGGAGFLRINAGEVRVTGRMSPVFGTPCATQGALP